MMSFQDFLEHAEALFKKEVPEGGITSFSRTHIFNLGEDEKIEDGIREIWEDLKLDMRERLPLPFSDMTCMSIVKGSSLPGQPAGWVLDRIVEVPITPEERERLEKKVNAHPDSTPAQKEALSHALQKLIVVRFEEGSSSMISWIIFWFGVIDGAMVMAVVPTSHLVAQLGGQSSPMMDAWLDKESQAVIKQASAISHPGNYIVRVAPILTPKEDRKVAQGRERPVRKMPHFIVVDHDILVGMSGRGTAQTHASPVPHERRGHWRRLAERCKQSRLSGKERVWVRPTYVGETVFADEKNHYEVLMDFGKKEQEQNDGYRYA